MEPTEPTPEALVEDAPADEGAADLAFGRWLFAQPCSFVTGAARLDQLPETDLPEIAFAGRSNVGKSSLINALTGRQALARTSNTPGRTQQINFFDLSGRLMLTDLPGYGFAKAPKRDVERWTAMVSAYLRGRVPLRRTCLLIDARHGIKEVDRKVMTMLDEAAVVYQVVLTKCDKPSASQLAALIDAVGTALAVRPAAHPQVIATSARKGIGIDDLRAALGGLASRDGTG